MAVPTARRAFRGYVRCLKIARPIANLLSQDDIDAGCLLEAAAYCDIDPTADLVAEVA